MGNCACGTKAPPKGRTQISADQQAKINEATNVVKNEVKEDVKKAVEETKKAEDTKDPEKAKEAKRKEKKAKKRLGKLEALEKAREVEALSLNDYNAAIRRLHSVTGEDPTNPGKPMTLPEGLEWMTTMLEVLWPSIRKYSETLVHNTIQPAVNRACNTYGVSCEFKAFDLGENSPGFGPMVARRVPGLDGKENGGVELSLGITYRSNITVKLSTTAGNIGVQNINFLGTLFMWMRPFVDEMPLVGGVQMAFVNPPTVELDWTGFIGDTMSLTGLQTKVRNIIDSSIAATCVVPNYIAVPMHQSVKPAQLRCPSPEGVLRLTVVSAANLPSTDLGGGCDPYVQVRVGAQTWRTEAMHNKPYPEWRATHDFLVFNKDQWVVVDVLDEDVGGSSDLIGCIKNLPVNRLLKRRIAEVPLLTKEGLPLVGEDEDGDEGPPALLKLQAEWLKISDVEESKAERLVSVQVDEVKGLPDGLVGPVTVRASVPGSTGMPRVTKGGTARPNSTMNTEDILTMIHQQEKEDPKSIARKVGMLLPDDHKLVAQALEKKNGEWVIEEEKDRKAPTEEEWWKKDTYVLNWQAFPDSDKDDDRIVWSRCEEDGKELAKDLKPRVEYYKHAAKVKAWHAAVLATMQKYKSLTNPYFSYVLHVNSSAATEKVKLEVLDGEKVVGSTEITVKDSSLGDAPDLEGPFEIKVNDATASIFGSVTVRSMKVSDELPASWNIKMDSLDAVREFTKWWKAEVYLEDWHYNKEKGEKWTAVDWPNGKTERASDEELRERENYYKEGADKVIGSGESPTKEAALRQCLRVGALTWGDYDVLIAKLRGETDTPSIAETLEWVNLLIIALWPHIKAYTETVVRTQVEPQVAKAAASAGSKLKLVGLDVSLPVVDLGTKPPGFNTIQCQKLRGKNSWGGDYQGMVLTLNNISFVSDINIVVRVKISSSLGEQTLDLGIKDVLFRCTVKTTMTPMLPDIPFIGALQVAMPNPPDIGLDFTAMADKLVDRIPGMNGLICNVIKNSLAGFCVVPNFIVVPMKRECVKLVELQYPEPIGVLSLKVNSAHHLQAGDTGITGAKSSDAFACVRLGAEVFKTNPVTSLDPVWEDAPFNFVVHDMSQFVDIEVFDADGVLGGADDSLGCVLQKETVIGGGIDLVRRGIPVSSLLRLGSKVVLDLGVMQKDEVSSSESHHVDEIIPCKGEDGQNSTIVVSPSWLTIGNDGTRNLAYLIQVQIDEIRGLPNPEETELGAPFSIKVWTAPEPRDKSEMVSKQGAAKPGSKSDVAEVLSTARRMCKEGDSPSIVAERLDLALAIVEEALHLPDEEENKEEVEAWKSKANQAIDFKKAAMNPHFNQRLHSVVPVHSHDEAGQMGQWTCPITFGLVAKDGTVVAHTTVEYDYKAHLDKATNSTRKLNGPFTMAIDREETQGGMLSGWGWGAKATPGYKGNCTVHGSIKVSGLRQRVMDAD